MNTRAAFRFTLTKLAKERMDKDQCPSCGKPKSEWNRRTDWRCCSKKCTDDFWKKNEYLSWSSLRMKALKRDNFTCAKCGKKTVAENLIGDHIIPIALGGKQWNLKNVQTLCIKCNKIKTKKDMKKIAKQRRKEKILIKGQEELK